MGGHHGRISATCLEEFVSPNPEPDAASHPLSDLTDGVYQELRNKARRLIAHKRFNTLDVTALVHESYLNLAKKNGLSIHDRHQLMAICVNSMRDVLVEHARRRTAHKRGSGQRADTLEPDMAIQLDRPEQVLALNAALDVLSDFNPRLTQIVECRFFAGLNEEETAAHLELSLRTVQRDWQRARAWLKREMSA